MRKVIAWIFLLGVFGLAAFTTTQLAQPTPLMLADDPKVGGGGG